MTASSIWMTAWDLEGREPGELLDFFQNCGLRACNLAFAYHGGRMLLPLNRRHVVYEQHPGALYYPADLSLYKEGRLQPAVAPQAKLVPPFLAAAGRRRFPVHAWIVLCHNDYLGALAPECCVENIFGERYTYALCPSNPEVQRYLATLGGEIATIPGVAGLDLEALGFLGYEHQSTHDKRGVTLNPEILQLLSICLCEHCSKALGSAAEELRRAAQTAVRTYLYGGRALAAVPPEAFAELQEMKRRAQIRLLSQIRAATGSKPLNLRLSMDPLSFRGKSTLAWSDLKPNVDAATVTFFGFSLERLAQDLRCVPPPEDRPVPVHGGVVFHEPDCVTERDIAKRLALLREASLDGVTFYSFSMAAERHFQWLGRALQGVVS